MQASVDGGYNISETTRYLFIFMPTVMQKKEVKISFVKHEVAGH